MGFLTELRSPEQRSWIGNWPASEFPQVYGSGATAAGVGVDEYSVLHYSPVLACTAVISGDVGSLPLPLYKISKNGSKERFEDHKLYDLIHDRPNPEMSSMVLRETMQAHALIWGNGFAEIQRDGASRPVALWPITPDRVTPFRERDARGRGGPLQYRVANGSGNPSVLPAANMLHVPGMGYDGTMGYSVVSLARESMALGVALERFGASWFGNGSSFGGVISFKPERLTPEFKQGVRESIGAMHTGVDRAHKFLLLGGEAKYDRLGVPPNDAQFLETRRFQIAEVARWFGGIPLHKLGDLERATFSNIEQQDIEYYKSCLRRWLVRWEQELNYKLISPLERRYQRIEFNVEGLLRGDSTARAAFYSQMFHIGVFSINNILEKENMNTIGPEGDVHYVPVNMVAAEIAMQGPIPTIQEVPRPKELPPAEEAEEEDDEAERTRTLLLEIAGNVSAVQQTVKAEREARSEEERARYAAECAMLRDDGVRLQQELLALRATAATVTQEAAAARAETVVERAARERAEADARTAQQQQAETLAQIGVVQTAQAAAEAARHATETELASLQTRAAELDARRVEETRTLTAEATMAQEARDQAQAAIAVAREAQQQAEAARDAAERQLAEAIEAEEQRTAQERADAERDATRVAEATAAKAEAERLAAAAQAEAEQAVARLAAVEEQRTVSDRTAQAAAAALATQREIETARLTGMLTAHRALIVHVVGRVVRRETDRARRHQATPEKLRHWMEAFYVTYEDDCVDELRPAIRAHLTWQQSAEDVDTVTRALVREHLAESQRQLRAVIDGEPDELHGHLERMLQRWEQERSNALADQILKEEIDHVRSTR